jgi:hypothetical protein
MVLDCNIDWPIIEKVAHLSSSIIGFLEAIEFQQLQVEPSVLSAIITVASRLDDDPPVRHGVSHQGG